MTTDLTVFIVISPVANEAQPEYLTAITVNTDNDIDSMLVTRINGGTRAAKNAVILDRLRWMPPRDDKCFLVVDDMIGNEAQDIVAALRAGGETLRVLCSKRDSDRYGVVMRSDMLPAALDEMQYSVALGAYFAKQYSLHPDDFTVKA